jgi:hypothetical protein
MPYPFQNDQEKPTTFNEKLTPLDWLGFTYYMGYDLSVRSDVERLFKNFAWVDSARLKSEKNNTRKNALIVTILTALGTGCITVLGSWIMKKWIG